MSIQSKIRKVTHLVTIQKHDGPLMLPNSMSIATAIDTLSAELKRQEELGSFYSVIGGYLPYDVAAAVKAVSQSLWGTYLPVPKETTEVSIGGLKFEWGSFYLPGGTISTKLSESEFLETDVSNEEGLAVGAIRGQVKGKHSVVIENFVEEVKKYLSTKSLYRGRAFRVAFTDSDGDPLNFVIPRPIGLEGFNAKELVYNADVERRLQGYLHNFLRHHESVVSKGVPPKRGVLLYGPYGTGKTAQAYAVALTAVANGWTFLYLTNGPRDLSSAIRFSKSYGPTVLYFEDLDKVSDADLYSLQNTLDGIESKTMPLLVICTTNHLKNVPPSLLRAGRLDLSVRIDAPDSQAVERLIRVYGRDMIAPDVDLSEVGKIMAGLIPAYIREAVERAKLVLSGEDNFGSSGCIPMEVLLDTARDVVAQVNELRRPEEEPQNPWRDFGRGIGSEVSRALCENGAILKATIGKGVHDVTT